MKKISLVLLSILILALDCHARGRGGLGGRSRTVYREKEKVVYVLCDECKAHMPTISAPEDLSGIKVSSDEYGWTRIEAPIKDGRAIMALRSKDRLDSLTLEQNGKVVFRSSYTGNGYETDRETERVSTDRDEWFRFMQKIPLIILEK
ncbi:MAG: hypothetical protein HZA81_03870 [Candidatus Taylorbacteria bacterium]|nr:hypothetical protein [Candidatus Taylorbacteria bacterium]